MYTDPPSLPHREIVGPPKPPQGLFEANNIEEGTTFLPNGLNPTGCFFCFFGVEGTLYPAAKRVERGGRRYVGLHGRLPNTYMMKERLSGTKRDRHTVSTSVLPNDHLVFTE